MVKEPTAARAKDAEKPSGKSPPSKGKKKHRDPRPMPDVARMYMDDQAEAQTPMVFVTRDGELQATVLESGKYRHLLRVDGENPRGCQVFGVNALLTSRASCPRT